MSCDDGTPFSIRRDFSRRVDVTLMAHTAARRDAGAEGAQGDASPPLTPVARALGLGVEARPAQPLLRDHSLLHRGRADASSSDGDDDAASFGAAGWGDSGSEGDGDVTAAEQDFGQALLASSVERDFGIMVLVGLTTRCSKPLLSLLLAYCLLVFGATLVTAAPNRPTTDQLCVRTAMYSRVENTFLTPRLNVCAQACDGAAHAQLAIAIRPHHAARAAVHHPPRRPHAHVITGGWGQQQQHNGGDQRRQRARAVQNYRPPLS